MRIQMATILAAISFPLPLVAQPSDGSLVGTIDGDPLRYECSAPNEAGKIECKFVQVLLSNKEKPRDLDAQLAQIPDMLTSENGEIDELCKAGSGAMRDSLAWFSRGEALEDGTPPPSDPREREELGKFVRANPRDIVKDRWERQLGVPPIVVTTSTGFSAAAVGPFLRDDATYLMDELLANGLIPSDAYLSSGNGFLLRLE